MTNENLTLAIKQEALNVGFFRSGIADIHNVDTTNFENWIHDGHHAGMNYLSNHLPIRKNPSLMLVNTKSVIIFAANYFPKHKQPIDTPQIAYYAYGIDYHKWMKKRLKHIESFIQSIDPTIGTRSFVDTAPIFERYWAAKAGVGFIGKSNNLIIPKAGSYFFLGGILIDVELVPDAPLSISCGNCHRCIDACPTQALKPFSLNSNRCLSYRTIEHKGDWSNLPDVPSNNCLYGCDACQKACPFNRFAQPTDIPECAPLPFLSNIQSLLNQDMNEAEFEHTFASSPIRRIRREGLRRNSKTILINYLQLTTRSK